jgi:hypothetical protein
MSSIALEMKVQSLQSRVEQLEKLVQELSRQKSDKAPEPNGRPQKR